MREAIIALVENHAPIDSVESNHTRRTLDFLHNNDNCVSASNLAGHITASAWVLSPCLTETLLTHHKKLNRWLQLGGHIEDDLTIQSAAKREAVEESGIKDIDLSEDSIFDIDVHKIPARQGVPEHHHYDIRFLFKANRTDFVLSQESNKLAWIKLAKLAEFVNDESLLRMCRKRGGAT